jgi:tetratricopeptide (TPR) repeat protein
MKPLCFVLMPFGKKMQSSGVTIDFNVVYEQLIAPAVEAAEMMPIRSDHEEVGGWIHKSMFERLHMCEYAVADLTGGNANVFYELGIRHALRPRSTVAIFQQDTLIPFDLAPLRAVAYDAASPEASKEKLLKSLQGARKHHDDSPVYEFLRDLPRHELDHSKTDLFRTHVEYSQSRKREIARAKEMGAGALAALLEIRKSITNLADEEGGTLVALYLAFRAISAFEEMERLYQDLPLPLQRTTMVLEQRAFALNRLGRRSEAEEILLELIRTRGANPETNGLLGRIYKDQWKAAPAGSVAAVGLLKKAIEAYLKGFEADWRDHYPGINAVTLMGELPKPDPRLAELIPVVTYSVKRQIARTGGDYWDFATLLELAVLARDRDAAMERLETALPAARSKGEDFAPETTAATLAMIVKSAKARGEDVGWIEEIAAELLAERDRIRGGTRA